MSQYPVSRLWTEKELTFCNVSVLPCSLLYLNTCPADESIFSPHINLCCCMCRNFPSHSPDGSLLTLRALTNSRVQPQVTFSFVWGKILRTAHAISAEWKQTDTANTFLPDNQNCRSLPEETLCHLACSITSTRKVAIFHSQVVTN